jgi:hypothetical protein
VVLLLQGCSRGRSYRLALFAHEPAAVRVVCCLARVLGQGQQLELLHKTQIEGIPGALAAFKGRLLAGVGPVLRLYELGKKKLLRKCEYKQLPQHVAQLHVLGSRIFVGDVQVGGGWAGRLLSWWAGGVSLISMVVVVQECLTQCVALKCRLLCSQCFIQHMPQ